MLLGDSIKLGHLSMSLVSWYHNLGIGEGEGEIEGDEGGGRDKNRQIETYFRLGCRLLPLSSRQWGLDRPLLDRPVSLHDRRWCLLIDWGSTEQAEL